MGLLVRELAETLEPHLVWELYFIENASKLEHKGTFNLDVPGSRSTLLEAYGDREIKRHDVYKAYVMVYLDA